MTSAFATQEFLAFSRNSTPEVQDTTIVKTSHSNSYFPALRTSLSDVLTNKKNNFIVSPICLSGSHDIDFASELESGSLGKQGFFGGFLQSRDHSEFSPGYSKAGNYLLYTDSRTNYRLNLDSDLDSLLKKMKRDSRSRVRKLLIKRHLLKLKRIENNLDRNSEIFHRLYNATATRSSFPSSYIFQKNQWKTLLKCDLWNLYFVEYDGDIVSGAIVANLPNSGSDYTFMGYDSSDIDASRANIILLYEQLSLDGKKFLDLGGGISEGDSLARFKKGLGSEKTLFKRVRFINLKEAISFADISDIKEVISRRWPR